MEKFGLIGISHRRATAEEMGRVVEAFQAISALGRALGLDEFITLQTCNRVELYWHCSSLRSADQVLKEASRLLFPDCEADRDMMHSAGYALNGEAVAKHLFSVICGLDSVVFGDEQIVGQFRNSMNHAREIGECGGVLGLLGDAALKLSRRVRKQVDYSRLPSSVAEVAAQELRQAFQKHDQTRVVLIGAGEMIRMTAARLKGWHGADLTFVNRTKKSAQALADLHGGRALSLEEFQASPCDFDALVAAASVHDFLLTSGDLDHLGKTDCDRLLLDLGVPQNIDPAFGKMDGFEYLDVIELGRRVEASRREIELLVRQIRPLIRNGLQAFREKLFQKALAPVANELRKGVEARAELEVERWLKNHLSHLPMEDRDLVEQLGRRVANQSVQVPLTALRRSLRDLPMGEELICSFGSAR
ncbi:MAG: hypothetical protein HQ519_05295 [Planctomycetes bacterium]|nr:hypothetical protein [Planctomycetota bacterium]